MKNTIPYCILLIVIIGLTLAGCNTPTLPATSVAPTSSTPVPLAPNTVILATGDWPPYVFANADDPGPIPAIITAAFNEVGLTPQFIFYPWKRAEYEVSNGNAFATFPYVRTDERLKEFDFSDPLFISMTRLFYNKKYHPNGISFESLADLRPYRIGGILGSWYEPIFTETGLQVDYVATAEQNFQKLMQGRIDLVVDEENTCWYQIRQLYPNEVEQFATLPTPLYPNLEGQSATLMEKSGVPNYLMASRIYPHAAELLQQFNTGLAAIHTNGKYEQIFERYQLQTGKP